MPLTAKVRLVQDASVRYLDSKPFKTTIEVSKLQGLHPGLIKIIDGILQYDGHDESSMSQKPKKEKTDDDESQLTEVKKKWKEIRTNAEEHAFYAFSFRKTFTHPSVKGRQIFALSLFNPFDLIDNTGQMHGFFLDPPIGWHVPEPKKDWVKKMVKEKHAQGKPITKRDYEFFERVYSRFVDQRTWLTALWWPTWSQDGVLSIHGQVAGFQSEVTVMMHTRKEISDVVSQHPMLVDIANSSEAVEKGLTGQLHKAGAKIWDLTQQSEEAKRRVKEKSVPIIMTSGLKDMPVIPTIPSSEPGKPTLHTAVEGLHIDTVLNLAVIALGILFIIGFATNPIVLVGLGILGGLLLIAGVGIYFWRKRFPFTEEMRQKVEEKVEEAGESVKEKVSGS